jgi:hypothetical protein
LQGLQPLRRHGRLAREISVWGDTRATRVRTSFTSVRTEVDQTLKWMMAGLSDHLGRLEEDGWGNGQPQGLGGLQVDDQLERGGLLDGQVGEFGAFQDLVHIGGGAVLVRRRARPVRHEATHVRKLPIWEDPRQPRL